MKNLPLEFFNEQKKYYPKAMEHFCNWIDEYKKSVDWISIFGPDVKFHHLPIDMQNGILNRYRILFTNPDFLNKYIDKIDIQCIKILNHMEKKLS